MKKYIIAGMAAAAALCVMAGKPAPLHIEDLSTGRDGSRFFLKMRVDPKQMKLAYNDRLEVVPQVTASDSSHSAKLPSFIVAGTNLYYSTLRNGTPEQVASLHRAGKSAPFDYVAELPFQEWMESSTVSLVPHSTGCCGTPKGTEDIPVARLNRFRYTPAFRYEVPLDTAEKRFNLSGRANIRFIVNKTNIDWNFANNYVELDSILRTVNAVKDNPDATVESITLKGFASPEGPYDNNVRLAKGRTEVVKEYVRNNSSFPASVYHTDYVPEDWEGLREWLVSSSLPNKDAMIAFIDDPRIPVRTKNDEFRRRFPSEYPFILANVYPPLRHTDYRITYLIRKYLNVDEIREVMKTRPQNLSLNELFLLANSYPQGSPEYDEVFDVAVRMYPNDPTANLNAANSAMNRGEYRAAERYLERAGDTPLSVYGRGILNALRENYPEAVTWFEKAEKLGIAEASEALRECRKAIEAPDGVTYMNLDRIAGKK